MSEDNLTPWQIYKKEAANSIFIAPIENIELDTVEKEVSSLRLSICVECPELIKSVKQCNQCGCFMPTKVTLKDSACPLGKW